MQISLSSVNLLKTEFENLIISSDWFALLLESNLYEFEQLLHSRIYELYDKISEVLIGLVSKSALFERKQKAKAVELGLKRLEVRQANLRLRTGTKISYNSFYAKAAPVYHRGSRHLSSILWQTSSNCSPMYRSMNCLFSVLCPSFEVSKELLNDQGIDVSYEKLRQVSLDLAEECMEQRSSIQLEDGETLSGKRVVIAIDGGRTRTRVYKEDKIGRAEKFDTPWREPKMFVITTCDENGQLNKESKPIYDCTFGDDEIFEILASYLKNLEIDQAESVQFLADGAPWIWNRVKRVLTGWGVTADKIIETLDYYHAIEHVNEMKVYFDEDKQQSHFNQLKEALWQGDFGIMPQMIKEGIQGVDLEKFNPYKYFQKHQNRIDYQALKNDNQPCASGIIESGIRRIINLRFKSPSSFWYPENAEKLIFMRGVALAGRWEIMMKNKFT